MRSMKAPEREPMMTFRSQKERAAFKESLRDMTEAQVRDELAMRGIVLAFGGDLGGPMSVQELARVRAEVFWLYARHISLTTEVPDAD